MYSPVAFQALQNMSTTNDTNLLIDAESEQGIQDPEQVCIKCGNEKDKTIDKFGNGRWKECCAGCRKVHYKTKIYPPMLTLAWLTCDTLGMEGDKGDHGSRGPAISARGSRNIRRIARI